MCYKSLPTLSRDRNTKHWEVLGTYQLVPQGCVTDFACQSMTAERLVGLTMAQSVDPES